MQLVYSNEVSPFIQNKKDFKEAQRLMELFDSEYCFIDQFDEKLIEDSCFDGYFPMATILDNKWVLSLKMHKERCVVEFDDFNISKKIKKESIKYKLKKTFNINNCVQEINKKYDDSWLAEKLIEAFQNINKQLESKVRFCAFELWEEKRLVAGEIGYIVGTCYSSLSGFHNVTNTGNIQLYLTNHYLKENHFTCWDLGMEIPYKLKLGGKILNKESFLKRYHKLREQTL